MNEREYERAVGAWAALIVAWLDQAPRAPEHAEPTDVS
jgi:hypothetical protein